MYKVRKREGKIVSFKIEKIQEAIKAAMDAEEKNYTDDIIDFLSLKVTSDFHYKNTFGGAGYDYSFILNGKLYNRTESKGNFIKGNYYLMAYDSTSPKSTQLLEINITDSLNQSCINGWTLKEIPFKVDTIYIKKKINKL